MTALLVVILVLGVTLTALVTVSSRSHEARPTPPPSGERRRILFPFVAEALSADALDCPAPGHRRPRHACPRPPRARAARTPPPNCPRAARRHPPRTPTSHRATREHVRRPRRHPDRTRPHPPPRTPTSHRHRALRPDRHRCRPGQRPRYRRRRRALATRQRPRRDRRPQTQNRHTHHTKQSPLARTPQKPRDSQLTRTTSRQPSAIGRLHQTPAHNRSHARGLPARSLCRIAGRCGARLPNPRVGAANCRQRRLRTLR